MKAQIEITIKRKLVMELGALEQVEVKTVKQLREEAQEAAKTLVTNALDRIVRDASTGRQGYYQNNPKAWIVGSDPVLVGAVQILE